jgi:heme exporter protein C
MNWLFRYANPHEFMRLSGAVLPFTAIATVLCIASSLYLGFSAPPDYQQGRTVLILFIHVPAATSAMMVYGAIAVCSLLSLVWRHPLSDTAARAAAPLGAIFTVLGLVTGSLWGRPMWGTYWAWDPRLTSFLLLLFLYFGYMALWNAIEDETRAARAAAVLALVGVVNIPIIKFSVDWWSTLHQGESIMSGKIAPVFLAPFLLMMAGYVLLFITLWMVRIRTAILERRATSLMQRGTP